MQWACLLSSITSLPCPPIVGMRVRSCCRFFRAYSSPVLQHGDEAMLHRAVGSRLSLFAEDGGSRAEPVGIQLE